MARAKCMMFGVPAVAASFPWDGEVMRAPAPSPKHQPEACHITRPEHRVRELPAYDVYVMPVFRAPP